MDSPKLHKHMLSDPEFLTLDPGLITQGSFHSAITFYTYISNKMDSFIPGYRG